MKYEKLEDGDQSPQIGFPAILRFDSSSLHEFWGESHVRCSTSLNPFFEALTLPGVQEVHPRVITSSWHMQTLGTGMVGWWV